MSLNKETKSELIIVVLPCLFSFQGMMANLVFEKVKILNIEDILLNSYLYWAGHVSRMARIACQALG